MIRDHGEIISAMNKSGSPIHSAACKTGRCRDLFKMRKRRAFCMPVNEYVSLIEISKWFFQHSGQKSYGIVEASSGGICF